LLPLYFDGEKDLNATLLSLVNVTLTPPGESVVATCDLATQRGRKEQEMAAELLLQLFERSFVAREEANQALAGYFEYYSSLVPDDPLFAEHLAVTLAPVFLQGCLRLGDLSQWISKDTMSDEPHKKGATQVTHKGKLLGEILQEMKNLSSPQEVTQLIKQQNLDINAMVPRNSQEAWKSEMNLSWLQ
jgi:hypothetical protein